MLIVSALAYYYAFVVVLPILIVFPLFVGWKVLQGFYSAIAAMVDLLGHIEGLGSKFIAWATAPMHVDTTELECAAQHVEFAGDRFEYGGIVKPNAARVVVERHVAVDNSAEFYQGQMYEFR